jgi:hypothetical protein
MLSKYGILLAILAAGLLPASASIATLGDPAPPLVVKEWIKGAPLDVNAGTNIYVVEFWASRNPDHRGIIARLNEIQKAFKDKGVRVVGISDESADKLKTYVARQEPPVDYAIAADDQRKTSLSYMLAYGQSELPHAFVVGQGGKMLWHGHPLYGLDRVVADIAAGRYNLELAIKMEASRGQVEEYRALARKGDPRAKQAGRRLLAARTNSVVQLCEFALLVATDERCPGRDFALAAEALDQAQRLAPTNSLRVSMTRAVLLFEGGWPDNGIALAKQTLASTTNSQERAFAEPYLRTMEKRLELAKTSHTAMAHIEAPKANPTNRPAAKP